MSKAKEILLIAPPISLSQKRNISYSPPLGLAYLAAVARKEGYKVNCLDALIEGYEKGPRCVDDGTRRLFHYGLTLNEISRIIEKTKPEIISLSCSFTIVWGNTVALSKTIKELDPDIKVVIGGAHPSAVPLGCLADTVDFVIIGEGEKTFLELINHLNHNSPSDLTSIRGIAFSQKGQPIITPPRAPITNLDELPFPARELLPLEKYIKAGKDGKAHVPVKRDRYMTVITSRGCPGRCIFCSIHCVWGRSWRARSPDNVVAELEELVSHFGISEIHFEDDSISLDKRRLLKICDLIVDRNLDISWTTPNGVRINTLDKEILRKMKQSGCYQLNFGIESGNEYVRNSIIKKPINNDQVAGVLQTCKELGIWTMGFFVIGLPGETIEMMHDSFNYAKKMNFDNAGFFIATPYPGTELFEVAQSKGYLPHNIDLTECMFPSAMLSTEDFSNDDVLKLQHNFSKDFAIYRLKKEIDPISIIKRLSQLRSYEDLRFLLAKARVIRFFT
jgi:magnesium-protoporphyrin IX monomethyl ester (oxidative) cyclase